MAPDHRPVRSLFSFAMGTCLIAVGLAAVVADLTPIDAVQSGSVAVLAAGAAILAVLVSSTRGRANG